MKKSILALAAMLLAVCVFADDSQAEYRLWSVDGVVCKSGNVQVKRHDALELSDTLFVDNAYKVTVYDLKNQLYTFTQSDTTRLMWQRTITVEKIVRKRQNAFIKVISVIFDETKRVKRNHKTIKYLMPGGLDRGLGHDKLHQSVYLAIRQIADAAVADKPLPYSNTIALLKDKSVDECTFIIENRSLKQDYVVNIISVDIRTGQASLCLEFPKFTTEQYLVAKANNRLILDENCFIDSPYIRYFLFATTDAYDTSVVQLMLQDSGYSPLIKDSYKGWLLQEAQYIKAE